MQYCPILKENREQRFSFFVCITKITPYIMKKIIKKWRYIKMKRISNILGVLFFAIACIMVLFYEAAIALTGFYGFVLTVSFTAILGVIMISSSSEKDCE